MRVNRFICDRCEKSVTPEDIFEWQEMLHWNSMCGYGSVFGDGTEISLDLCQNCVKDVLFDFIQVLPDTSSEQYSTDKESK